MLEAAKLLDRMHSTSTPRSIFPTFLILPLILAGVALADDLPLPDMGPEWFERLKNPETRIAALYELGKAHAGRGNPLGEPEQFAADHQRTLVFPCPQPDLPGAWAVLVECDWELSVAHLSGAEPEVYEPHPLETERQRKWDVELSNPPEGFAPWQAGQSWFEALSGFLVDPSGRQLGEGFFASPGVPADFDGDGRLDLLEVSRLHLESGMVMDGISIGPLATHQPRKAMIYCNPRKRFSATPRSFRFDIRRSDGGGHELAMIPADRNLPDITFRFHKEKFVASEDPLPDGILIDTAPEGDGYHAARRFLKSHGEALSGVGGDGTLELDVRLSDKPVPRLGLESRKWSLPETDGLSPREAAHALAGHQFSPFTKEHLELASIGEAAQPATLGWLEHWTDGGGWGDESVVVWKLGDSSAECWKQVHSTTFVVSEVSAEELGRRIAIMHELDRIRSVPKTPFAPRIDHDRMGGDDHPVFRVRTMTVSPDPLGTVFNECTPSFWKSVGSRYDRNLACVIATLFAGSPPEEGRTVNLREIAADWLAPDEVAKIPPGLSRAAVGAIGKNQWIELKPGLEKLLASFGPATADEKRLAELSQFIRENYQRLFHLDGRDGWTLRHKLRDAEKEKQRLEVKLTGDPRYELRGVVEKSLEKLNREADAGPGSR